MSTPEKFTATPAVWVAVRDRDLQLALADFLGTGPGKDILPVSPMSVRASAYLPEDAERVLAFLRAQV